MKRNTSAVVRAFEIAAALCLLLAPGASGQSRSAPVSFLFDGGVTFTGDGLLDYSRDTPTLDDTGIPVGPGAMRFTRPRLLCGAPDVTTVADTTGPGTINILAAGVQSDNQTPAFIVQNSDWGQLQIHRGTISGTGSFYNFAPNPAKGNLSDFLRDSVDELADEAWVPKAAVICHGSAIALCNVAVRVGSNWDTNRIGFAVCNFADLAGPKQFWWRRHAVSDVMTRNTFFPRLGANWSLQTWWVPDRDGKPPTRYWIVASDYRNNFSKDGCSWAVFPITRSSASATDWAADSVVELPGRVFIAGSNETHAHSGGLTRFGEHGLIVLGSRGDGLHYNMNYTWTLQNEADYKSGASVAADSFQWLTNPGAWTGPRIVHGNDTTAQSDASVRRLGNQWVSVAPGPQPGTFVTGSDETSQTLWISSRVDTNPAQLEYTPLLGTSPTNWMTASDTSTTQARYLCFHIKSETPNALGSRYVAQLNPGQFEQEHRWNARLLYSPDGVNWGQCWAHGENEQCLPQIVGGRIWTGSYGQNLHQGIRSTPIPTNRMLSPLRIAPGGFNFAAASTSVRDIGVGNVAFMNPALPEPPPCSGGRYTVRASPQQGGSSSAELGTYLLAENVPGNAGMVRLKFWVRPLSLAEGGVSGASHVQARLVSTVGGNAATTKISGYSGGIVFPGGGVWTPFVLTTDLSTWGSQTSPARLELQLRTYTGICVPMAFYMAIDSVVIGGGIPSPSNPGATPDSESLAIRNLSLPDDWTVLLAGMVPYDNWDRTMTVSGPRPLVAMVNSTGDRWVQVFADAANNILSAKYWNGKAYESLDMRVPYVYFSSGSPVLFALSYARNGENVECEIPTHDLLRLTASVGGTPIAESSLYCVPFEGGLSEVRFSSADGSVITPMDWFGGRIEDRVWSPAEVRTALRTLSFLPSCRADFDGDGFLTGVDFDLYVGAFEAGDMASDFDSDGFITGVDFDLFVGAYEAGC